MYLVICMKIIREESGIEMISSSRVWCSGTFYFHWHDNIEVVYIVKKSLKVLIDGELYEASKGDFIFISEQTVHNFIIEQEGVEIMLFQFPVKILLNMGINVKPVKTHIVTSEIKKDEAFSKRIDAIIELLKIEKGNVVYTGEKNPVMQSLFAMLYFSFMEKFPNEENDKTVKKEKREFYKVAEYINEYFLENINVQLIADKLYMSRGRLSEMFLKYSGMSIKNYINTLRVNNANELLDEGKNITEAALSSGFQSVRTFNNIYKSVMSITPTEYVEGKKDGTKQIE